MKRYLTDPGVQHPDLDLRPLRAIVHALYTHWLAAGAHRRDFPCALVHTVHVLQVEYILQGSPALQGCDLPVPALELAAVEKQKPGFRPLRFFNDDGELNGAIDCSAHHKVLWPHFVNWCGAGFLQQDFQHAVRDVAEDLIYSHSICESLGGLGGGLTGEQFLSRPLSA